MEHRAAEIDTKPIGHEWRARLTLLGVLGAPATGKTTLVRAVAKGLGASKAFGAGFLRGHYHPAARTIVVTHDDLPAHVPTAELQRDARNLLHTASQGNAPIGCALLESPRLLDADFLRRVTPLGTLHLVLLHARQDVQLKRRLDLARSDDPARFTDPRLDEITTHFPVRVLPNEHPHQLEVATQRLVALVRSAVAEAPPPTP